MSAYLWAWFVRAEVRCLSVCGRLAFAGRATVGAPTNTDAWGRSLGMVGAAAGARLALGARSPGNSIY